MKINLTFKTPDILDSIFYSLVEDLKSKWPEDRDYDDELDEHERDTIEEESEGIKKVMEKWIEYGEYIVVEFDTDTNEMVVLEKND